MCFDGFTDVMRKRRSEVTRKDAEMRKRALNQNARAQERLQRVVKLCEVYLCGAGQPFVSPAKAHTAGNTAPAVGQISVQLLLDRGLPLIRTGLNDKAGDTENGADASATLECDVLHSRRIALQNTRRKKNEKFQSAFLRFRIFLWATNACSRCRTVGERRTLCA